MKAAVTEDVMKQRPCPVSKLSHYQPAEHLGHCLGTLCPLAREADRPCDDTWVEKVKEVALEIGETNPNRKKAAAIINSDPEKYGFPRLYYCGLGGVLMVGR